jgi:glycosyltransferase 2 family protein
MATQPDKTVDHSRRNIWLGIILSIICLGGIFFFIEPAEILAAMAMADFGYLGLATVGIVLFLVLRAVRWGFMLSNDAPWSTIFHIQNIGYMLTNIFPLRIGDVARAVLIGNVPPITISRGVSTMVVERILDMLFIVAIFPFTLAYVPFLEPWMQDAARGSGIAAIVGIAILIIAANQRPLAGRLATQFFKRIPFLETGTWVGRIDRLLAGLDSLTRPKDGLILTALSIVVWLPILFSYYAVLVAVGIEPTLPMVAFVVCAAAFSIAAPSSPGQIGVFHAGVIAALAMLGQPRAEAASFAFLYHLLNLLSMVVLGLIGIYATGSTWGKVIESTQAFMRRTKGK